MRSANNNLVGRTRIVLFADIMLRHRKIMQESILWRSQHSPGNNLRLDICRAGSGFARAGLAEGEDQVARIVQARQQTGNLNTSSIPNSV